MIRVAAVADIHAGPETAGSLAPLLTGLHEEADILFLAGDLTRSGKPAEAEVLAAELADVGVPVVAVLGNHDYHSDQAPQVTKILSDAGITVLEGEGTVLEFGGRRLGIAGAKGFGGGFAGKCASAFGEPEMKAFIRTTTEVADRLAVALQNLDCDVR